jgi:transcriptional regulator GlxA family with amidase domain
VITVERTLSSRPGRLQVALVATPGCSLLELVGAHTVWATAARLSRSIEAVIVGSTTSPMASSTPLRFRPQQHWTEVAHPDVLLVVGGVNPAASEPADPELLGYLGSAAESATVVAATGSGALLLAAAGLLKGRTATTRADLGAELDAMGVGCRPATVVEDGRYVTGAGTSAAIDLSLLLLARLRTRQFAQRVQIAIEWDPHPPFGSLVPTTGDPTAAVPDTAAPTPAASRRIALVIYEGLTALDLIGPLEVFAALSRRRPEFVPVVVAERSEPIRCDAGLEFLPNRSFDELPDPEVLVVPGGGLPTLRAMADPALRRYLRTAAAAADHVASVCTGALLLASIGLLAGRTATTHWAYRAYLPSFGASYVQQRWVTHDGITTAAGVSAGIDMALWLAADLTDAATARRVQRDLQYEPDMPFGGIDYDRLPGPMRAVRGALTLTVPAYSRRPRQLLRQGA